MTFTQLIPFDPSKGGNTPNLCLDNVRRGYGIANKYGSAWEAWEHTQQHNDPVPDGLAVPLFYSYTAIIDGVTANYGHINVQLPNGTVWSDGNIYASIDAYTANHTPRFVGWGESVNDFKIIGGTDMPTITPEALQDFENWKAYGARVQAGLSAAGLDPNAPDFTAMFKDLAGWKATGIADEEKVKQLTAALAAAQKGVTKDSVLAYLSANLK